MDCTRCVIHWNYCELSYRDGRRFWMYHGMCSRKLQIKMKWGWFKGISSKHASKIAVRRISMMFRLSLIQFIKRLMRRRLHEVVLFTVPNHTKTNDNSTNVLFHYPDEKLHSKIHSTNVHRMDSLGKFKSISKRNFFHQLSLIRVVFSVYICNDGRQCKSIDLNRDFFENIWITIALEWTCFYNIVPITICRSCHGNKQILHKFKSIFVDIYILHHLPNCHYLYL